MFNKFVLLAVIWMTAQFATAQNVTIPDSHLRAEIERLLQKSEGDAITVQEMASLTSVRGSRNVHDLTGLEHATNLTHLTVGRSNLSDLTPLSGLTGLTSLTVDSTQVSNLTPLSSLTSLRYLDVERNQITDISPISNLPVLDHIAVGWNPISDVSALANITSLKSISFRDSPISDLTFVESFNNLRLADISYTQVTDLTSLVVNSNTFASGARLELFELSLNQASIDTHIPALRAKGVNVFRSVIFSVIHQPHAYIKVGDTITVDIMIENVYDLLAIRFTVEARSGLKMSNIERGDLFPQTSSVFYPGRAEGDPPSSDQTIHNILGIVYGHQGKTGNFKLATITFKAVRTISSDPIITTDEFLLSGSHIEIFTARRDTRFRIHAAYDLDLNDDNVVNLSDANLMSAQLYRPITDSNRHMDLDANRRINLFDLYYITALLE